MSSSVSLQQLVLLPMALGLLLLTMVACRSINQGPDVDIRTWLREKGLPETVVNELATSLEKEPPPEDYRYLDFYTPKGVFELNSQVGICLKAGYIALGTCPNGDFIVVDTQSATGAIYYLPHDQMWNGEDLRKLARRIAASPTAFQESIHTAGFPGDYYDNGVRD